MHTTHHRGHLGCHSHFRHQRRTSWLASLAHSSPPFEPSLGSTDGRGRRPPKLGMCWDSQSCRPHSVGRRDQPEKKLRGKPARGATQVQIYLDRCHDPRYTIPPHSSHHWFCRAVVFQSNEYSGDLSFNLIASVPVVPQSRYKIHAPMHDDDKRSLEPSRSWRIESRTPTHQVVANELCVVRGTWPSLCTASERIGRNQQELL